MDKDEIMIKWTTKLTYLTILYDEMKADGSLPSELLKLKRRLTLINDIVKDMEILYES